MHIKSEYDNYTMMCYRWFAIYYLFLNQIGPLDGLLVFKKNKILGQVKMQ